MIYPSLPAGQVVPGSHVEGVGTALGQTSQFERLRPDPEQVVHDAGEAFSRGIVQGGEAVGVAHAHIVVLPVK